MSRLAGISLVSFPPLPVNEPDRMSKTLAWMGDYVEQAAQCKSDLVAFPEVCTQLGTPEIASDPWRFESLDGPTISAMSKKAREYSIYVVCPLATLEKGQRYNSAVLLDRNGQIVGVYHKNFPTHRELDMGIVPGTEIPVFETSFGRVGICICFDLNYWEVGAGLCTNKAELVLWPSMWEGGRMLTRWSIEFGFYMGAIYTNRSTFVDVCGREITSLTRDTYDTTNGIAAPLTTATIDMDRRLLHPNFNIEQLKAVYEKYGSEAIYAELLPHESLLIFGSNLPNVSTDEIIREFGMETMRSYLARVRRDRQLSLKGKYSSAKK